jgi:hypothetical protein
VVLVLGVVLPVVMVASTGRSVTSNLTGLEKKAGRAHFYSTMI